MHNSRKEIRRFKILKRNFKYFIIIFLISVCIGFLFGKKLKNVNQNLVSESGMKENYTISENILTQNINKRNKNILINVSDGKKENILETSFNEEKITLNTKLVLRKYYIDCNHIISRDVELPEELINLTKEELKEDYSEWEIEEFSSKEVILYKKVYGICNEHFIIESGDDFIEVYSLDEDYDRQLYEVTNISVEYLTEEDIEKLEEGIYVYGVEELNSTLESFE